jgi:hypothetical protein
MPDRAPVEVTNLDRNGSLEIPWSRVHDQLAVGTAQRDEPGGDYFVVIGTTRPDGRPHAASIWAIWHDGDFYFTSGPGARKSRNLVANPACTLAIKLKGLDLMLEGEAERVTDQQTLEQLASMYRHEGWPAEVEGDAFTAPFGAPSAGPPPWHLYRITYHTAFVVATEEPNGATRWRFGA